MKKLFFLLLLPTILFAQTPTRNPAGFLTDSGTIAPSAILEARSTTKGFLAPRMTTTQRNAISSPATSLLIFNTTTGQYEYWDGSAWTSFGGKFLKLTGTETGVPMTGDIEVQDHADGDFKLYNDYSRLLFTSQTTVLGSQDPDGINGTASVEFGGGYQSLGAFNFDFSKFSTFTLYFDKIDIGESGNSAFKGLDGGAYWGANYTDNTYTQKKYVDDAIAAITPTTPGLNDVLLVSNTSAENINLVSGGASTTLQPAAILLESTTTDTQAVVDAESGVTIVNTLSNPVVQLTYNGDAGQILVTNDSGTRLTTIDPTSIETDTVKLHNDAIGVEGTLDVNNITASRAWEMPDNDGTVLTDSSIAADVTFNSLRLDGQTASTVAIFDGVKNLVSASTATYPSLTELSYGKGVTSAIQTQLNAKEPAISGTGFVYSASGTKSVVSDTGTGNVVRDTAPSLSGLVTHAGGTLTGASAATMFQSMTGTFNGTGIFKGIFMNVTNTASNSQSRLIDLQTGGNSRFNVSVGGDAYASNSITAGAYVEAGTTAFVSWTGRSRIYSPANGDFRLTNTAGTDFGKLQFGGSTSSFPAVKRNAATLEIKLADDSEFAAVQTLYDRFGAGSPEGIVTAPVSAVYHRTDGGAGTSLYVKESGTGNTGWVAK